MFAASRNWPHYHGRLVLYDKENCRHYALDEDGQPIPTVNAIAAAYAAEHNPDGTRKSAQKGKPTTK